MTTFDDLRPRARTRARGHVFEDFVPGRRFDHHWGRTLTAADNTLLSTLTLSYNPLYFNEEHARATGHDRTVVNPMLLLLTVVGLSVEDLSESPGGAALGFADIRFHRPVLVGETVTASSTVIDARRSASRPGMGIVTWLTEGSIEGDVVVDYQRTNLVATRDGRAAS